MGWKHLTIITTVVSKGPTSFRLRNIKTIYGTAPALQDLIYEYDNFGNVHKIIDNVGPADQTFEYDNLHRLVSASSPEVPAYSHTYNYDSIGNMMSGAGKSFNYPLPGSPHPHAPIGDGTSNYDYDSNGNLISKVTGATTRTFSWDVDNRLTMIEENETVVAEFAYDYTGDRIKKAVGGNAKVYIGKLYECTSSNCTKYIFSGSQRIASRPVGSTDVHYYHSDHLGSTNLVTNIENNAPHTVQALNYYPYGSTRSESMTGGVAHKFTGQDLDDETGLYNYRARYYDPDLMRFISADIIRPNPADPQTLNRYSYTRNNPIRFVDPTGMYQKDFHLYLGAYIPYKAGFPADIARQIGKYNQGVDDNFWTDPRFAYVSFRLDVLFKSHAFIPHGGTMEDVLAYRQEFLGRAILAASQGDWKTVGEYFHFRMDMSVHGGLDWTTSIPHGVIEGSKTDYPYMDPGRAIETELAVYDEAQLIACAGGFCNQASPLNANLLIEHATFQNQDEMTRSTLLFQDSDFNTLFPNDPAITHLPSNNGVSPDFQTGGTIQGCQFDGTC